MQLPIKDSLLFWCDPSERFVFRDSSNKITSVIEKVSDKPLLPASTAAAPTWVANVVNGQPVMRFAGAQSLKLSLDTRSITTGTKNPLVVSAAVRATSFPGGDNAVLELGSATLSNPGISIDFTTGPVIQAYRYDDTNLVADAALKNPAPTPTAWHIYTAIYDGTNMILRIDGVEINSIAATNGVGHFTGDQIVIGDFTDGTVSGFAHGFFTGDIGQVIVYGGDGSPDLDVENYLKAYYGI